MASHPAGSPGPTGQPSTAARTWLDYQLDLIGNDRSDAPRIPAHQIERLHPWGAPRSWDLLVERPRRPAWPARAAAGVISVACGIAAAVSDAFYGVIATTVAGLGQIVGIGLHLAGIIGADGHLGTAGRLLAVAAIVAGITRLGWRLTRWGVAPIGDDR